MRIATTAVINTLQGGVDYSNGGFYWDGTDILYIPSAQKNRYASQGVYVPISQEAGVCIFENNLYIYLEKKMDVRQKQFINLYGIKLMA
ncbi:MAG: hypothetical protein JNM36_13040 [Chitinophagales bacterium]|nr:hypothetical protein [Chitinophagales bacterium]